jgi:hypothetical protein
MHITINTDEPLSDVDKAVLAVLAGTPTAPAPAAAKKAVAPAPAVTKVADAVALATKMIADGESVKVKAALKDVGAERVSTLELDQVPGFMSALDAS